LETLLLFIHVIVCMLLIIIVLLQSGKSADLAGAFGMMGSQSSFGPRGSATFLSKMTTTLAILFMVTSLSLWIIGANKTRAESVISRSSTKNSVQTTTTAPKTKQMPISIPTNKAETTPVQTPVNTPEPAKSKTPSTSTGSK